MERGLDQGSGGRVESLFLSVSLSLSLSPSLSPSLSLPPSPPPSPPSLSHLLPERKSVMARCAHVKRRRGGEYDPPRLQPLVAREENGGQH